MDLAGYRPTLNEVAALFGKSSRWISDLRASGEMPADGATVADFVAAWGSYCGARAGGAGGKSIDMHKARLAAEKADEAAMKNAQRRGEMLPRTVVTLAVQGAFARVRAKLVALPSKAAPAIASMRSAVPVEKKLRELVHEALAELAVTVVEVEPVVGDAPGADAGNGGGGARLVAGDGAPAGSDGQPVGGPVPEAKPRGKRRARPVGHEQG